MLTLLNCICWYLLGWVISFFLSVSITSEDDDVTIKEARELGKVSFLSWVAIILFIWALFYADGREDTVLFKKRS